MKYLVSWTARAGGSAEENESLVVRSLAAFAKWSPPEDTTFLQVLTRLDGSGGFAVVESDNPASVAEGPAKFGTYFEFSVIPVLDVGEGVAMAQQGIAFRRTVG
jgi:hypothetical protein